MIQFEELKKESQVLEEINKTMERQRTHYRIIMQVLSVLEDFNGKEIAKRIETKIKALPGMEKYTVMYDTNYGMYHLRIWGNDIPYDSRMGILMGHVSNGKILDIERVRDQNRCYTLEKGRTEKLQKAIPGISAICDTWNKGIKLLKEAHKAAEKYGLEYTFDMKGR